MARTQAIYTSKGRHKPPIHTGRDWSERFLQWYQLAPAEKIAAIRQGMPARSISELSQAMDMPQDDLILCLGLSRATVNRLALRHQPLSPADTERVAGIHALIGQLQAMSEPNVAIPAREAAKLTARWIRTPMPALGGRTAASYLDTVEGQKFISDILAMTQSGAYA